MRKTLLFFTVLFAALLGAVVLVAPAHASFSGVIISEVAWMGTPASTSDEWVELANPTPSTISLDGWTLSAQDGTPSVALSDSIPPDGFFLLERTDDDTLPGVSADQIYTGALLDSGERLSLRDASGVVVDAVDATAGWPAGDKTTDQTMERRLDGSWGTSTNAGGTPKAANSIWSSPSSPPPPPSPEPVEGSPTPSPEPPKPSSPSPIPSPSSFSSPSPSPTPLPEPDATTPPASPEPSPTSPASLILSELLPDPEGRDNEGEFVEIFNSGDETAVLDGWRIRDASGVALTLKGPLLPGSYAVFRASETNLPNLNNDGDTVELLDPSGVRRDGVRYGKTEEGFALARSADGTSWAWTAEPTPGALNRFSQNAVSSPAPISAANDMPSAIAEAPAVIAANETPADNENGVSGPGADALEPTEEHDGTALAAALRTAASPAPRTPLFMAALVAILAGLGAFSLRVWMKRRREPSFVVESPNDESKSNYRIR